MNKKCVALTEEQYKEIIEVIRGGFEYDGVRHRPNKRVATALVMEATLGIRISDVLSLKMSSFIKDGSRWRLDIVEKKTGKVRNFTVPSNVYSFIQAYAYECGIGKDAKLFDIIDRQVQRLLENATSYLGYQRVGSHSFRKYFATEIYKNNKYNIELVRVLLQHSSSAVTARYIGIGNKEVEDAIQTHVGII